MPKYTSEPSRFRTCLNTIPIHEKLMAGINVVKVASNGKTQPAYLTLSEDRFTLYITQKQVKNGKVIRKPFLVRVTSIGSNDDEAEFERSIDIGSVDRLQSGRKTLRFELARKMSSRIASPRRTQSSEYIELDTSRCFSIIYSGERTLDMMVSDEDVSRDDVLVALNSLRKAYSKAKVNVSNDVLLLRLIWADVDTDRSDSINGNELADILNRINFYKKKGDIDKLYNSFAKMMGLDRRGRSRGISFENTVTILHKIKRDSWNIKPVQTIFFELFGEFMNNNKIRNRVSAESFMQKFVWKKQGESQATLEEIGDMFKALNRLEVADVATNLNLEPNDPNSSRYIDKDRFEAFLMSRGNDIFDPEAEKFDPEIMDRPLSEYWINSSHNTYLTGDQWQSRSSVEMYMNALYRGCRCLELDCFDGHRDNQNTPIPLVYHGLTITSKILFFDIIDAIKFFLNSNPDCYPIILSLENHCSLPFQEAMASYMISVFGNKNLFIPDETNLHQPLPSPEELKGKVLLKGRRITDKKEDYYRGNADDDTDSDDDSVIDKKHTNRDDEPLSPRANVSRQESTSFSPELSRITIFHGVRMNTFEESRQKGKDCMLSINESKARKLSKIGENRVEWVEYNNTHLSRVYPSGKRVDSSNFNPMISWSNGVQMCALNIQTPDPSRRLNDGRFRQNENCGYVLKPEILRLGKDSEPLKLSIQVLSGTCLPKAKGDKKGEYIDPYVQVTMFDVSSYDGRDTIVEKYTHHVVKNGFNPIWQHNPFKFKVDHPEIAMLQFTIWNNRDVTSSDTFIGSASIPVSCVREGYRSVHLFDANNKRNGAFECATLLVDVGLKIKSQEIKMW